MIEVATPEGGNPDASVEATDTIVDWVEVSRAAHQLGLDHGHNAHFYAAKLAEQAAQRGDNGDAEFWRAVSASLVPRESFRSE